MKRLALSLTFMTLALGQPALAAQDGVALRPPMGWNSFDAYDSIINEEQFRATVDFMAKELRSHGWEYATIDYIWWHDDPGGQNTAAKFERRVGHAQERLDEQGKVAYPKYIHMDEWGRTLPSTVRFPSAADGKGFKPLADYAHAKGLKFGIHIMRGVHRLAMDRNSPVLGTNYHVADFVRRGDHAAWLNNTLGVEHNPAGQAFYDSLFRLYASWGVDLVKADDMMGSCGTPFQGYSGGEIEMMRNAIDKSGRPMVLSLSCGEAPIGRAQHVSRQANMWRVSGDFWDKWPALHHMFELLDKWSAFIQPGHWPDADMIPFGKLSLGGRPHGPERLSNFTRDEHFTLMSLFAIARSPLIIGSELRQTPRETLDTFYKNDEVIAVNQKSRNNHQVVRVQGDYAVWLAQDEASDDYYVALFNLGEKPRTVEFELTVEELRGQFQLRDLWARKDLGRVDRVLARELPAHGAGLYRLSRVPGSSNAFVPLRSIFIQNQ